MSERLVDQLDNIQIKLEGKRTVQLLQMSCPSPLDEAAHKQPEAEADPERVLSHDAIAASWAIGPASNTSSTYATHSTSTFAQSPFSICTITWLEYC